jgi:hypothetical protein
MRAWPVWRCVQFPAHVLPNRKIKPAFFHLASADGQCAVLPQSTNLFWRSVFATSRCLFLALSGHHDRANPCPLSGAKRTFLQLASMSVIDPKRT